MSNKSSDKKVENDAVKAVEVVKDDTVVYKDGDFEDYNAENDYETSKSDKDAKSKEDAKSDKNDKSDKGDKSSKEDKSEKDDKSTKKGKSSKKDKSDEDDKSGITMAGIYQWASKLKDDFTSDALDMKQEVSEKAAAMTLSKLMDAVDLELAAFDKSLDVAKNLITTAEERREKIAAKKEKYQGMIDKLDK